MEHAADAPALGRALLVPDIACLSDNLRCCFQAWPAALGELSMGALAACEACTRRRGSRASAVVSETRTALQTAAPQ
jgi:hypothetical protein